MAEAAEAVTVIVTMPPLLEEVVTTGDEDALAGENALADDIRMSIVLATPSATVVLANSTLVLTGVKARPDAVGSSFALDVVPMEATRDVAALNVVTTVETGSVVLKPSIYAIVRATAVLVDIEPVLTALEASIDPPITTASEDAALLATLLEASADNVAIDASSVAVVMLAKRAGCHSTTLFGWFS